MIISRPFAAARPSILRVALTEWETRGPGELKGYHLTGDPAVQRAARELNDSRRVGLLQFVDGLQIEARSYIGRLCLGDLELIIRPKISPFELTALIAYAFSLSNTHFYDAGRQFYADLGIADILVHQFADEVEHLLRRGLTQRYVRHSGSLSFPRGRINFNTMARQPYLAKAELPCSFYERTGEWELNRLLAAGLAAVNRVTIDAGLRQRLARLADAFPIQAPGLRLTSERVGRALENLDRLTERYAPALALLKLLVDGGCVTLEHGLEQEGVYSFLFDMNMLFQRLLARLFGEYIEGATVSNEFPLNCLDYVTGFNPRNRPARSPRPDFAVWRGKDLIALLDAKYRDLWSRATPRDWIYQLALYASAFGPVHEATILYPAVDRAATEQQIELRNLANANRQVLVRLRPVIIPTLASLLAARQRGADRSKLRQFCMDLVPKQQ